MVIWTTFNVRNVDIDVGNGPFPDPKWSENGHIFSCKMIDLSMDLRIHRSTMLKSGIPDPSDHGISGFTLFDMV